MSKYIIELGYDLKRVVGVGVKQGTAWFKDYDVDDLEELCDDYINEHYGSLQDDAYQKGFEDGKAVHDKGCEGCKYQANRELTCPCSECANNFKNQWTAKNDKIEVGDEVADKDGDKTIVTNIHGDLFDGLCSDGSTMTDLFLDDNRKTGRHFDIASILEDMRHD